MLNHPISVQKIIAPNVDLGCASSNLGFQQNSRKMVVSERWWFSSHGIPFSVKKHHPKSTNPRFEDGWKSSFKKEKLEDFELFHPKFQENRIPFQNNHLRGKKKWKSNQVPISQRSLKEYSPGIVDCKPFLKQCRLYGKNMKKPFKNQSNWTSYQVVFQKKNAAWKPQLAVSFYQLEPPKTSRRLLP